jgi:hypothetical protein
MQLIDMLMSARNMDDILEGSGTRYFGDAEETTATSTGKGITSFTPAEKFDNEPPQEEEEEEEDEDDMLLEMLFKQKQREHEQQLHHHHQQLHQRVSAGEGVAAVRGVTPTTDIHSAAASVQTKKKKFDFKF